VSRSAIIVDVAPAAVQPFAPAAEADRLPPALQYLIGVGAVGLAVAVGLGLERVIPAANLTLLFVLPVLAAAMAFGWRVSMAAAVAGAIAFDFFFTEPKYSLAIASAADLWSTGLLLAIGAAVSTLAAYSRRLATQARRAAIRARALQALAHAVVTGAPRPEILERAALTLNEVFGAPAVILARGPDTMEVRASAGGATLSPSDRTAAATALDLGAPTHGGAYPIDRARFDFWPLILSGGEFALGVDFGRAEEGRPADAQEQVEAVMGYLSATH